MLRILCVALLALAGFAPSLGCDSSDGTPLVDETGFIKGSNIRYTAPSPLGEAAVQVSLIGLPGAITEVGGTLLVSPTPLTAAVSPDGSFVVTVEATLDTLVTLQYALGGRQDRFDLVLDDGLDGIGALRVAPSSGSSGSSEGTLQVVVSGSGTITVDLDQLLDRSGDVIVFNEHNGASAEAAPSERTVSLPGGSGDRICVFAVDAASASPTLCTNAP